MAAFEIYTRWATNTSSRNAFYQTIFISRVHTDAESGMRSTLCKAFLHYGRFEAIRNKPGRPVEGGILKEAEPHRHRLEQKLVEKSTRDYIEDTGARRDWDFTAQGEPEFRKSLTTLFGAAKRDHILVELGLKAGETLGALPPPEPSPEDRTVADDRARADAELSELLNDDGDFTAGSF